MNDLQTLAKEGNLGSANAIIQIIKNSYIRDTLTNHFKEGRWYSQLEKKHILEKVCLDLSTKYYTDLSPQLSNSNHETRFIKKFINIRKQSKRSEGKDTKGFLIASFIPQGYTPDFKYCPKTKGGEQAIIQAIQKFTLKGKLA